MFIYPENLKAKPMLWLWLLRDVTTLYAHNSKLLVRVGQTVEAGDIVSLSGSTGRSTGPHLHFEVRVNGERTNPRYYLPT